MPRDDGFMTRDDLIIEAMAMFWLNKRGVPRSVSEVSERINLSKSHTSIMLGELAESGWLHNTDTIKRQGLDPVHERIFEPTAEGCRIAQECRDMLK